MTTIPLTKPVVWHGETLTEIRLKEPSGIDFINLGEPRTAVFNGETGNGYYVEQPLIIKAYLEKCIEHEGGAMLLAQMNLADAQKLTGAFLDFFRAA